MSRVRAKINTVLSMSRFNIDPKTERSDNESGQALVEFTLIFAFLLVLTFIPADFGIAFYTGQLAQNASREGARIAAAEPNLTAQTGQCILPCGGASNVLQETAKRLSSALMPGAQIDISLTPTPTCQRTVTVQISGTYNYFFYQIINLVGASITPSSNIVRSTVMRWEHQPSCVAS